METEGEKNMSLGFSSMTPSLKAGKLAFILL